MNAKHLGDSYDIVKQALLRALSTLGEWQAHPMLTAPFDDSEALAFGKLLGVGLLSREVLTPTTNRQAYLAPATKSLGHVFLDPDTGVRLTPTRGRRAPAFIFGDELVGIAGRGDECLTLVFDQSLARGRELVSLRDKREWLMKRGVSSVAYCSHACFLVLGTDAALVAQAREALLLHGRIPECRLVA